MMIEIPLPTPRSVILSPNHIVNMVPATKTRTPTIRKVVQPKASEVSDISANGLPEPEVDFKLIK